MIYISVFNVCILLQFSLINFEENSSVYCGVVERDCEYSSLISLSVVFLTVVFSINVRRRLDDLTT